MLRKALQSCVVGFSALHVLAGCVVPCACRADAVDHPNPVMAENCASSFSVESEGRLRGAVSYYKHQRADVREGRQIYRDGEIGYRNEYRYDPLSGLLLEVRRSGAQGQEQGKSVFSYLPTQSVIIMLNYGPTGRLLTRYRFDYDQTGRITSRVIEAADGRVIETSIFRFSGEGLLISREAKDQSRVRIECVYDIKGRLVRSAASEWLQSGSAMLRDESFSYWPDRVEMHWRVKELSQQSGSEVQSHPLASRVRFNEHGDVVSDEMPGSSPLLLPQLEFRYTYDRHGNWVTRLTFCRMNRGAEAGAELCEAEYRAITYHDRRQSSPPAGERAIVLIDGQKVPNGLFLLGRPLSLPFAPSP